MSDSHTANATWNISTLLRLILFLDSKFSTEVSEFISHWMASPVLLSQQWRHRRSLVSDWLASAAGEAWYHSCNRVREYAAGSWAPAGRPPPPPHKGKGNADRSGKGGGAKNGPLVHHERDRSGKGGGTKNGPLVHHERDRSGKGVRQKLLGGLPY